MAEPMRKIVRFAFLDSDPSSSWQTRTFANFASHVRSRYCDKRLQAPVV